MHRKFSEIIVTNWDVLCTDGKPSLHDCLKALHLMTDSLIYYKK